MNNISVTHAPGGSTFTLTIQGKPHTYTSDKAGKRQAILDGLAALETVTVGPDSYLSVNQSLEVVAAVLYPDGIQTEAAYRTVTRTAEKACARLGYGEEVTLAPPVVAFDHRGAYRKRLPPVDAQLVLDTLSQAGTSSHTPRQEIACAIVWNKVAQACYGRHWSYLTDTEKQQIETQVAAIVAGAAEWEDDLSGSGCYFRPLPVDDAEARRYLDDLLRRENGRPVTAGRLIGQAQLGAYGRGFYTSELAPALQAIVAEVLSAHGYCPTPQDGQYWPQPPVLKTETAAEIETALAVIEPVVTQNGHVLLLADLTAALTDEPAALTEWQAAQLLRDDRIRQTVQRLGYRAEIAWVQPYHFVPKRDGHDALAVLYREVRAARDPDRRVTFASGLSVLTPALVIDDVDETLVYLEMVGAKQSVKANWAALAGGGKVHWLGRQRIRLNGMKAHVRLQATLPCGWANHILIHKQASLKEMNPEQPFYLLDDGTQPIPPLFYPMLNKCLALPLLPEWAGYLWENGRAHELITLLDEGEGQGYAAWRVLSAQAEDEWQRLVQVGIHSRLIRF